jgi:protein SCO1/2
MRRVSSWLAMLACAASMAGAQAPTPSASIYQLEAALTNQDGQAHGLDVYRGHPVLVAMFYSSCPAACPLIIDTLRATEKSLTPAQLAELRVLMISVDPERDTPAALHALAAQRRIDTSRWTLARADASDVRTIAALLNVQYRKLPNGEFNHSSVITLLSTKGEIVTASFKLGTPDPELLAKLIQ